MQRLLSSIVLVFGIALAPNLQAQQSDNDQAGSESVYELQVRNLPPSGQAWNAVQPLRELPEVTVQNINMDSSRVIIRVRGDLDRPALEQALEDSDLILVYMMERNS